MTARVIHADCLDAMRAMPDASIDAVVTDPPYGLSFMGRDWDHGVPGPAFWIEALRVAKPGAHLVAFGGTRTYHRLACAIEDAGWEIRDCLSWLYGSGFPKSLDVSKAIDRAAGAERKTIGSYVVTGTAAKGKHKGRVAADSDEGSSAGFSKELKITAPATDAARQWQGWGTALKPAWEPCILARKPLVGTVAANVLAHGTGAINVDACRIGLTTSGPTTTKLAWENAGTLCVSCAALVVQTERLSIPETRVTTATRNAGQTQTGQGETRLDGTSKKVTGCSVGPFQGAPSGNLCGSSSSSTEPCGSKPMDRSPKASSSTMQTETASTTGLKTCVSCGEVITTPSMQKSAGRWPSNIALDEEAAAMLDEQTGERKSQGRRVATPKIGFGMKAQPEVETGYGDSGGASRFFYTAKASRSERNDGCDAIEARPQDPTRDVDAPGGNNPRNRGAAPRVNSHPTVKPVALMRWLVRMVTPPGGVVLDPFCGSGSTLVAAIEEGFDCIGVELEAEYVAIIEARVAAAQQRPQRVAKPKPKRQPVKVQPAATAPPTPIVSAPLPGQLALAWGAE